MLRTVLILVALLALLPLAAGRAPSASAGAGCIDPTPDGGGAAELSGIGAPNHYYTRQQHVCPGETDVWTVHMNEVPSITQYVGAKVTKKMGDLSITVEPEFPLGEMPLASGEEYRTGFFSSPYTYILRVTGHGDGLSAYRLQLCESILLPCVFSAVPEPALGDANCDGAVDALDALTLLQYASRAIAWPPCMFQAEVGSHQGADVGAEEAALILQYVAGLIDEFPGG